MSEDETVRANRLGLLRDVRDLIWKVANLSRVVVGEGKPGAAS